MTTPEPGPFSPEFVARIANELFAAIPRDEVSPDDVPEAVGAPTDAGPVRTDALTHAGENPVTTADTGSTSAAPLPSVGAVQTYTPPGTSLGELDDGGLLAALDGLDLPLSPSVPEVPGQERVAPAQEHAAPVPGQDVPVADPPEPQGKPALAPAAPEVERPVAGDEPGQIPDAAFLAHKLREVPTSLDGLFEAAAGDHPYLQGQYEAAADAADVDDRGSGADALDLMQHLAAVASELLDDHGSGIVPEAPEVETPDAVASQNPADAVPDSFHPALSPATPELHIAPDGFDAHRLREDFPILKERINGHQLVWLDNGATTQKPQQVIDRLSYFYEHENSNVHRTAHTLAGRATDAYEGARDKVRRFINAPSSDDIVWVRGTTEGINLVANTFGEQQVCEGDEVLISHLEHHANIVPWQMLCQRKGATLRVIPVDDTGQIILSEYERLITPRTRIIAFTQVSNALGTITPAKAMVEIAHRHGVPVLIDGAQGVLHMPVDVQELDCDFYVFSGHKMFAPTGIGVVYGKSEHLESMPPWQGGGNMIDQVHFDHTTYQAPPWRFEAGTGSIADAVGLGAAIDYLERIGMSRIEAAEQELLAYGTEQLLTVPGLCIYGHADHKAGVLSFNVEGFDPIAVGEYLDRHGIAVRAGHHCAQPILRRFGVEATVRAALALYNTREDIDRLVDALRRMVTGTPAV